MTTLVPGVLEGQTVQGDLTLSADVCVVGSGAGGAVTAARLAEAGLSVVVLEEGGYFTQSRFRMREADAFPQLYQEAGQRVTKDLSLSVFQGRAVGGTTVVNWTTSFRTPEATLERWRTHHAVTGLDAATLAPHFEAVEARLGIAESPLALANRPNKLLYDGARALGWAAEPLRRNVRGCAHTGFCGYGCPIDAKQSMLITYLPDAMRAGATVISRCRVERLELEGSRVVAVRGTFLDALGLAPTGATLRLTARSFVLAAGAIGTPAILLRSGAPDPHQRAGRRTFLHPVVAQVAIMDERVDGFRGAPQSVASHQFADRGADVGYFLEAAPVQPALLAIALPGFGHEHHQRMQQLRHLAPHVALAIDGHHDGEEGGRVTLRPSGAPVLDYTVSPKIWAAVREAQRSMARIHLAGGARQSVTGHTHPIVIEREADLARLDAADYGPSKVGMYSAHVMGGAGMSDDPRRGVVRPEDLRHHQLDNLHVVDGSVFPTSLGVNPQESIYGLAHLVAGRLAEAWT